MAHQGLLRHVLACSDALCQTALSVFRERKTKKITLVFLRYIYCKWFQQCRKLTSERQVGWFNQAKHLVSYWFPLSSCHFSFWRDLFILKVLDSDYLRRLKPHRFVVFFPFRATCTVSSGYWIWRSQLELGKETHLPVTWTHRYERWNLPAHKAFLQLTRNTRETVSWKGRVSAILKKKPWANLLRGLMHSIHSKAAGVWVRGCRIWALSPCRSSTKTFNAWQCPYWHLTFSLILLLLPACACVSC